MSWDLSCTDWSERLRTGRSLVPDLPLDLVQGNRAVAIFNKLRLADVPGTPTLEEAGGDWFRDVVRALWGSLDQTTRERMIRELFLLVPKKNSKTTNGSLLMLTALLMNERPNATLIMTAPVQDVAQLAFDAAANAIALDPVLERKLHVREHLKTIIHRETKAELQIMTFDPAVLTGQKPVAVLVDELHVVAKMSKAASAIRQLRGGMLPFPEAFMAFITTQSEDIPSGVFHAELQKARAIRDGKREGAMLAVLYEFNEEQQKEEGFWKNPDNWHMVTPNAGKSITIGRLKQEMQTAEDTSPEELRAWASQHLNVEIGLALHSNSWAGARFWEQQGTAGLDLDSLLARCEVVTVGIDGGGLDDLLGLSVLGREFKTGNWLHWGHAWAHPIVLERHKQESQRFQDFDAAGHMTIVDAIGEDIAAVVAIVKKCEDSGLLDRVGVDPAGLGSIVDELCDVEGGPRLDRETRVIGISQGWRLNGAIKATERKLAEGTFHHGDSPLMAWCVGNCKTSPAGNAVLITKQYSGSGKIDPVSALFDSVTLMNQNPQPRRKSYGMLFLGG